MVPSKGTQESPFIPQRGKVTESFAQPEWESDLLRIVLPKAFDWWVGWHNYDQAECDCFWVELLLVDNKRNTSSYTTESLEKCLLANEHLE